MAPENMLPDILNPDYDYPKKENLRETNLHRR